MAVPEELVGLGNVGSIGLVGWLVAGRNFGFGEFDAGLWQVEGSGIEVDWLPSIPFLFIIFWDFT